MRERERERVVSMEEKQGIVDSKKCFLTDLLSFDFQKFHHIINCCLETLHQYLKKIV